MISLQLTDLLKAYPGKFKLRGESIEICQVSTDSRSCQDALFAALVGEKHDAHKFCADALKNGAKALLVEEGKVDALGLREEQLQDTPMLLCQDTTEALGLIGLYNLSECRRLNPKMRVGALTGSCGKTTVKELTLSILSNMGRAFATEGNFNNDVGVPLTLLKITPDYDYVIIEQGASHPGDIKRTCRFVPADVALITNIGRAHLEGFKTEEGVYEGKTEIFDAVFSHKGIGLAPSSGRFYEKFKQDYKQQLNDAGGSLYFFGDRKDDTVMASHIETAPDAVSVTLNFPQFPFIRYPQGDRLSWGEEPEIRCTLKSPGAHNAYNAAAACALALYMGADIRAIRAGLNEARTLPGRMEIIKTSFGTLINDAYNASFNSVLSGLDVLALQEGLKIMCFADMGELGDRELELHYKVGEYAKGKADVLLTLGPRSRGAAYAFGEGARHFESPEALYVHLLTLADKPCCIMLKGSHAMHLDAIAQRLLEREQAKSC